MVGSVIQEVEKFDCSLSSRNLDRQVSEKE
jgi:hypothetical protein